MIRKTIVLLILTAFVIPAVIAEPASYESGTCNIANYVESGNFIGTGESKLVSTSSDDLKYECQGQLELDSSVPDKAIVMKYLKYFYVPGIPFSMIYIEEITTTITPSGHFTVIGNANAKCTTCFR